MSFIDFYSEKDKTKDIIKIGIFYFVDHGCASKRCNLHRHFTDGYAILIINILIYS